MRNTLFIRQANSSVLSQLPFDVLEDITEHLSRKDLCNLMLASRECSSLAVRALYSTIALHNSSNIGDDRRAYHTLRRRQFSFFVAISQHPTYTRFIRRIQFEFTDQEGEPSVYDYPIATGLVWRTFAKCIGVVYIDLKAARPHQARIEEPERNLFPNLRRARIEGAFSGQTLDKVLNGSSSIKALDLSIGRSREWSPEGPQGSLFRLAPTASPFDDLRGEFSSLRTLNIQIRPWGSMTSLAAFLQRVRNSVTLLILRFSHASVTETSVGGDDAYWTSWITQSLVGFKVLEAVSLQGITPGAGLTQQLQDSCPCLKRVMVSSSSRDDLPEC